MRKVLHLFQKLGQLLDSNLEEPRLTLFLLEAAVKSGQLSRCWHDWFAEAGSVHLLHLVGESGCDLLDSRNANADDYVPHVLCLQIFGKCHCHWVLQVWSRNTGRQHVHIKKCPTYSRGW